MILNNSSLTFVCGEHGARSSLALGRKMAASFGAFYKLRLTYLDFPEFEPINL